MKLLLVGDVMLGRLVNKVLRESGPDYPWSNTKPRFDEADWRACNLECVFSDRGTPWDAETKAFHFRSERKNLAVLQSIGINAVSMANNHSFDFGYEALTDTLAGLDALGIRHAGAGANFAAASRLAISEVGGRTIGLAAFTDNEPAWEATADRPGVFHSPIDLTDNRARYLLRAVEKASRSVDVLIVSAHWGPNWGYRPPVEHPRFAHALIDHGATIVYGHSGHVCRGIEIYKSRPILYCTGNFIDDYAVDDSERNDRSFIFTIEVEDHTVKQLRLCPTVIRSCRARLAGRVEAALIAAIMKELCGALQTSASWNDEAGVLEIAVK